MFEPSLTNNIHGMAGAEGREWAFLEYQPDEIILLQKNMNKYSNKGPYAYEANPFRGSYTALQFKENLLKPANLACKTDQLTLSAHSPSNYLQDSNLTPKNSGKYGERSAKLGDLFSKSIHTTPNKERIRKQHSFVLIKNKEDTTSKNDCSPANAVSPKQVKNDRSQRLFPTRGLNNEASTQRIAQAPMLRQTVSNATAWQYRNMVPSSTNISRKEGINGQQPALKRKVQSEYCEVKDYKSKFASKQHSRNTSRTEEFFQNEPALHTERVVTNATTPNKTPRVSKDHYKLSAKEKIMSQTDPVGSFFQPTLARKTTSKAVEVCLEDFQLGACKGQGRFGKVFPAIHKKTGAILAIKKVTKQSIKFMLDQFVQEIKICLFMNHPNIVRMYGFFTDRDNIYILMEYMEEGSLYKQVKMVKRFKEEETSNRLFQICEAVRYLHSHDILHRDIKPENIVLTNGVSKLCDFGWATYSKERRTTYCGTLDYVCPQILQGESYDNFVDIWAIGVLAYEMLVGKAPFYHISRKETMKSIMSCEFSIPVDLSMSAKLFIMKALQKRPDQRFTIDSLLRDRFLAQASHN